MRDTLSERLSGKSRVVAAVVSGVVAVSFIGVVAAFGTQMGSGTFDPTGFLANGTGALTSPDFNAAYNSVDNAEEGKANKETEQQQESTKPSTEQVEAIQLETGSNVGNNALVVTDGQAGLSVAAGANGSNNGTGAAGNGTIAGPLVNGDGGNGSAGGGTGGNGGEENPGGGGDNPGGGGGTPVDDPDPTAPTKLPDSIFDDNNPDFGDGVNTNPADGEPSVAIYFSDLDDYDVNLSPLYSNEVFNDFKLLCSAYYYVTINGVEYRLTKFSDNFEVVSHSYDGGAAVAGLPSVIGENASTMTVYFRVRANSQSAWHDASVTLDIYPYKVLLTDESGSVLDISSNEHYKYPNYYFEGDIIHLAKHYSSLQPEEEADGYIHQLFSGWSETQGGASVGGSYKPEKKGLTILRPCDLAPVPDNLKVQFTDVYSPDVDAMIKKVTLVEGPDSGELVIPEGIENVDENYRPSGIGTLTVPSTVDNLGDLASSVSEGFVVADGNPYYLLVNNLLIDTRTDESYTAYIPLAMAEVIIPENVSELVIPEHNAITKFVAEGDNPSIQVENDLLIQWQEDMFGGWNPIAIVGGGMERIKVPADAVDIQVPANNKLAWIDVEEGNAGGYSSFNGMMGMQTVAEWPWESDYLEITLIPLKMEIVTIPSGLNSITIPYDNSITRYENGDGEDFFRGDYWAAGGALCAATGGWLDESVNEIFDVPSALEALTIPADIGGIIEGAIHDDSNLASYEVEEGNETYSSENGLLIEKNYEEDPFDPWGEGTEITTATVPPKMTEVHIPAGVDKIVAPDNNCITAFIADEGSTIRVENGMIVEDLDGWDELEMCQTTVRTITMIPAGMTKVIIPDDVEAIADEAIPTNNSIEWFEADSEHNFAITTSNGMLTTVEEDWFFGDIVTTITKVPDHMKTVTIAEDISSISEGLFSGTNSIEEFIVESEWSTFSVRDGLLYEYLGDHYNVIGIPCNKEEVTIPAYIDDGWNLYGITNVAIPKSNSLMTLRYEGVHIIDSWDGMETDTLVTPDFSNLKAGTQIIVPDADFTACYAAWSSMIEAGGLSLMSDAGQSSEDFIVRDGATLSKDGSTLIKIADTMAGVYVVPDGVTTIAGGATAECPEVNTVLLPASVTTMRANAFTNENLKRVLFTSPDAPSVDADAVSSNVSLQVASANAAAYEAAFGDASSQMEENNFTFGDENGFTVLRDHLVSGSDNHVVILDSPDTIEHFDKTSVDGATDINTAAFMNRTSLSTIDLPASVKTIGVNAFKDCKYVTLFNSASTDTITAAAGSFEGFGTGDEGGSYINGMSFNAMSASIDKSVSSVSYSLSITHCYALCPKGSSGYDNTFGELGSDYTLTQVGAATLLCGTTDEGNTCFGCNKSAGGTLVIDSGITCVYSKAFFNTDVQQLDISSATPLSLIKPNTQSFLFKENNGVDADITPGIKVRLTGAAEGQEEAYIDAWKYPMSNRTVLSGARDISAQNTVRMLLGMEVLPPYALSADGTTLEKFVSNPSASFYQPITIPSSVTSIAAGACTSCGTFTVYFEGPTPPSIESNSFTDGVTVKLIDDAADHADDYVEAWKAPLYQLLTNDEYTADKSEEAEALARAWLGLEETNGVSMQAESAVENVCGVDGKSALASSVNDTAVETTEPSGSDARSEDKAAQDGSEADAVVITENRINPATTTGLQHEEQQKGAVSATSAQNDLAAQKAEAVLQASIFDVL